MEEPEGLRRGRRRLRAGALRELVLWQRAGVRQARRRPVQEPSGGGVRSQNREAGSSRDEGREGVHRLGRDLFSQQSQHGKPHGADGARGDAGRSAHQAGAVDVGAHAGQGPRVLHRLGPRPARLEPQRFSSTHQERHPVVGRRQARKRYDNFIAKRTPLKYEKRGNIPNYERRPEPLQYQLRSRPRTA